MVLKSRPPSAPSPFRRTLRQQRGIRDWLVGFIVVCLLLAGAVVIGDSAKRWLETLGIFQDRTTETAPIYVSVAGRRLTIPANWIRIPSERDGGEQSQLDLELHFPDLEGYSAQRAASFDDITRNSPIVNLVIRPKQTTTDTAGRLATIYEHFLGEKATDAPEGLVGYRLRPESGLANEVVYFENGSTRPYAVHCQVESSGAELPQSLCLREIHAGDAISVQIRFHKGLLPQWRQMDKDLRRKLGSIGLFTQ